MCNLVFLPIPWVKPQLPISSYGSLCKQSHVVAETILQSWLMAHGSTAAHFDEPQLTPVHFHLRNINVWAEYAINYMTIWHYTSYIQLYLYRILSALSQAAP